MKFKELLNQKNITQSELARKMDVTRGLVSFWCNGKNNPSIIHIVKLSRLLNVSIKTIVMCFYKEVETNEKKEKI